MKNTSAYINLIGLHVFLGILVFLIPFFSKAYFIAAVVFFLWRVVAALDEHKTKEVLMACAYFVGAEVLFRMTKGAVFYESSKYLVILFMIIGMLYKGISGKGYPYFLYLMFLIPSVFVASTTLSFDANFRTNIAFVLSGPVCLGISALFCYNKKLTREDLLSVITYLLLPVISLTTYLFFYNPSIKEVLSGTASNFAASGGFGPNQVATALGIGIFVATVHLFMKSPTLFMKIFNALLLAVISYRAVVTFSRGGVIAALITIVAFLVVYYFKANRRKKSQIAVLFLVFTMAMTVTWMVSSNQTMGLIDMRYANQDALGREKEDITTGRGELFMKEIEGFLSNPFLGIGSSRAKDQRLEIEGQGLTSHSEVSRTLSEHGMFGIAMLLILLLKPFDLRAENKRNIFFYAFLVFWFATINHSSMRIAAPAFIYGLALLNVTYETHSLHRKQVKKLAH